MLAFVFSSDSIYGAASAAAQKTADRCQIFRQCPEDGLFIYQTATKIGRANRRGSFTWAACLVLPLCFTLCAWPLTKLNRSSVWTMRLINASASHLRSPRPLYKKTTLIGNSGFPPIIIDPFFLLVWSDWRIFQRREI